MKRIVRYKLFEDPDTSYAKDNQPLQWDDNLSHAFGVNAIKGIVDVSPPRATHEEVGSKSAFAFEDYQGRIWPEAGVIAFWVAPPKKILLNILEELKMHDEIFVYEIEDWNDFLFDIPNPDQTSDDEDAIFTLAEYPDDPNLKSFHLNRPEHTKSPMLKKNQPKVTGGGSIKYAKEKPLAWRQALQTSESVETLPKKKWTKVDPEPFSDELISLVQTAYKNTPEGSFINTKRDLAEPDWLSIDFDENPDIDATIFYREARPNESWTGKKIQGLGHDGSREAINVMFNKFKEMLNQSGVWVESSDAVEHVLYKTGVSYVDSEEEAQKIFPDSNLKFIGDKGKYTRSIGSKQVKETIFGKPKLKPVSENFYPQLNENPNNVIQPDVWRKKKEQGKDTYTPGNTETVEYDYGPNVPFMYYDNDSKMATGNPRDTHWDMWRKLQKKNLLTKDDKERSRNSGRLFPNIKVLTFWNFPKDYNELVKVIKDLEKETGYKFLDDPEYLIEIPAAENKSAIDDDKGSWGSWTPRIFSQDFIPFSEYKGGHKRSEEELGQEHIASPMSKKKKTVPQGVGSKAPQGRSKPLAWRQAMYAESFYPRLK